MVWMQINFFLIYSSDEVQAAIVTKSTPLNVYHHLTTNPTMHSSCTATDVDIQSFIPSINRSNNWLIKSANKINKSKHIYILSYTLANKLRHNFMWLNCRTLNTGSTYQGLSTGLIPCNCTLYGLEMILENALISKTSVNHTLLITHIATLCLTKNRTPATFCNNSNSPGSIAIDFDKNNR